MINRLFECKVKNVVILCVTLLLFAALFIFLFLRKEGIEHISKEPDSIDYLIDNVYNNKTCRQYFEIPADSVLEFLSIQFATYEDTVETGEIVFFLYAEDEELPVYVETIKPENLKDNGHYVISFDYTVKSKNGRFYYELTGTGPDNNLRTAAVWGSKQDGISKELYINDRKQSFQINTVYKYQEPNYNLYIQLLIQLAVALPLSFLCLKNWNRKFLSTLGKVLIFTGSAVLMEWFSENAGFAGVETAVKTRVLTGMLIMFVQFVLFGITQNLYLGVILTDLLLAAAAIGNYFVMSYRGTTAVPSDLFGLGTLRTVIGNYHLSLDSRQIIMIVWIILWIRFVWIVMRGDKNKLCWMREKRVILIKTATLAGALVVGVTGLLKLSDPDILEAAGIDYYIWDRNQGYYKNGPFMNFMINMQFAKINKPEGYTKEAAQQYLAAYEKKNKTSETKPNVILIMNESFADFDFYDSNSVKFSEDPLPFIHSLTKNTIKGRCYVSVFGGLTANSEMEALTGHSMAFFPAGTVIYQQFAKPEIKGLAEYFNALDYQSVAIHPNLGTNWNREVVYENMGFDRFITGNDFQDPEYVRWISDKATYDKIIELYEKKKEGQPLFAFDVTMQGHGGYYTKTDWDYPITLKSADFSYANEYLSSTYVSDQAFQYLINYFSKVDEPTVIFMFGDHQPALETGFHELLLGKSQADLNLEETQSKYVTPFVLWTNFTIKEDGEACISSNQIGTLIKENAGLPLTSYDRFLEAFHQNIPLINQNGYMDGDGKWHELKDAGEYGKWLKEYSWIQYGIYCDGLKVR